MIDSIINQVKDNDEKSWLNKKRKYAHEPNLSDRIFDVLSSVDLNFKKKMWLIPLKQVSLYVVDLKALEVEKR